MPQAPKIKGKKLPPWAIAAAVVGGLLVAWLILRRGSSSPSAVTTQPSSGSPQDQASTGAPAANAAPADSLSPAVLDALGQSLGQLGTLGGALADVANTANTNLGYVSSTALQGSFALAQTSIESNTAALETLAGSLPTYGAPEPGYTLELPNPGSGVYRTPEPPAKKQAAKPKPAPKPPVQKATLRPAPKPPASSKRKPVVIRPGTSPGGRILTRGRVY